MTISVVIPTLNEQSFIGSLLKDLESQTLKPNEIIVVDGSSEDRTKKIISSFKNVKLVNSKRGVGLQRKTGASLAKSETIIFLDADVWLKKDFLQNLLAKFKNNNLDIAVPLYLPYKSSLIISAIYLHFNLIFVLTQKFLPSGAGSCILIKKSLLKKAGSFNENLTYDDIELIRRAARNGRFGVLFEKLYVSDRRFKKYGVLQMFIFYIFISIFFLTGQFKLANLIKYKFASYKET